MSNSSSGSIGAQLVELHSVASTNNYAAEHLALSELRHGAVILAHAQTEGRGQRERAWISAPGLDLTFSIVLVPEALDVADQFVLGRIAALAVHDTIRALQPADVKVKWPNDVLVGQRKIAGILIQNELSGHRVRNAVVGVGLNVNNAELPVDLNATSLRLVTGREHDRMDLLRSICRNFDQRWSSWESDRDPAMVDYVNALWARERWVPFMLDGTMIRARPLDVERDGRLIIEHEDGRVLPYGLERLRFGPRG